MARQDGVAHTLTTVDWELSLAATDTHTRPAALITALVYYTTALCSTRIVSTTYWARVNLIKIGK